MCKFKRISLFAATAIGLSACAVLPEFPDNEVTTGEIVRNIKCELRHAIKTVDKNDIHFKNWDVGVKLTLTANHKGSLTANSGWSDSIVPQLFTLSGNVGLSGQGIRIERINFNESVSDLRGSNALGCSDEPNSNELGLLGGQLGIADLFRRSHQSSHRAKISPTGLDYTLKFIIVKNADLNPRFSMLPWGGNDTGIIGAKWSSSYSLTHNLDLAFLPGKTRGKCPLQFKDAIIKRKFGKLCPTLVVSVPARLADGADKGYLLSGRAGAAIKVVPKAISGNQQILQDDDRDRRLERALDGISIDNLEQKLEGVETLQ